MQSEIQMVHGISSIGGQTGREPRKNPRSEDLRQRKKLDELPQDYVCSTMIYKEAFDHEYDTPKDWELKEINNVMNNSISGWEKISSHRFAEYGIQRGWRRIADKEEFHKLPEHAETPFDKK